MTMDIRIPEVGESVREALVASWRVANGGRVSQDQPLCELETDKITLELNAEATGVVTILVEPGRTVPVGTIIGTIEQVETVPGFDKSPPGQTSLFDVPLPGGGAAFPPAASPSARKLARERGVSLAGKKGSGPSGQVLAGDLDSLVAGSVGATDTVSDTISDSSSALQTTIHSEEPLLYGVLSPSSFSDRETIIPLSPIRKRIAERLLAARQNSAMLTTFNEADMTGIQTLRTTQGKAFFTSHGIKLGYMGFFIKACSRALMEMPMVNARLEENRIIQHHYCDIGVAVGGQRGLVVPVLRGADSLTLAEVEIKLAELTARVRENRITISDLEGGTFTITNGGVYGSLLSTPLINPPQSAVLGMHAVQERPVVVDGAVVPRPMIYLALSYDHRIIDGREAVQFLKRVRELVEKPTDLFETGPVVGP